MKILLVDDERFRLESLERGLRLNGYRVFTASNAAELVGRLGSTPTPTDIIITDYTTAFTAGSEVIQTIGEMSCKIPVLMMTDSKKTSHEWHPLWPWCVAIIEKPFELDQLVRLIESVGKRSHTAR